METLYYAIRALLFVSPWIGNGGKANIILTQVPVEVEENSSVTLSCYNFTWDQQITRMYWSLFGKLYAVSLTDNPCRALDFPFNRTDIYTLSCSDIHNISLAIREVNRLQHGDQWACRVGRFTSSYATIYVKVPVETIEIMDSNKGYIAENQTSDFHCKSSFSRPKQDLYWFLNNGTSDFYDDERIISNITESIVNETIGNKTGNILTSTESTLTLKVQRSLNNQQLYCLTNDTSGRVIRSTMAILNISYPPDGSPYIRGSESNGTYDVINTKQGNLTCIVVGGNPLPNLNWICFQSGNQTMLRSSTTVTSYFTWTASMDNNKVTCTCQSFYIGGQTAAIVSINVLYPPSLPEFYIQINNRSWLTVSSEINITENNQLKMKCNSDSNPVSTYSWTGPKTSNNETLAWDVVNNRTEGYYTCTAINNMTQTNGPRLEGKTNNNIRVNVLYPPSAIVFTIRNQSADISVSSEIVNMLENVSYILTCHARGKPEPTYSWTGPVNLKSDVLNLTNINRKKAGNYSCEAENTIYVSTGNIHNGRANKSIYLNIQYASEVTDFYVDGHKGGDTVIANQGENATFLCNVDSNPNSSVGLQFKDKYLFYNMNTRNLTHLVRNLPCSSAGIYYCFSSNEVNNGKSSWKKLTLIVRCPPLPEKDLNINITTLKYVPAKLSFKAMDYLDSDKTSFTWQKENNASQWESVKHDTSDVKISTFHLTTNLTIVNVTGSYSGKYRVVYNNSVGGNTQLFQLSVADLPDPPEYFDYLKDSLTSTQVTVVWTKGYGGGLRQTFVLHVSQTSQPTKYDYINETENKNLQHTITGLTSGTRYQLTLWSTNSLGQSLSQTIAILTKELQAETTFSLTAAVVGSVSSLVAVTAGVSVVFLLYKRRYQIEKTSSNGDRTGDDSCSMNTFPGSNNATQTDLVYEGLKPTNERSYAEMKEQTYDILKKKQKSSDTKDPIYTNLKL